MKKILQLIIVLALCGCHKAATTDDTNKIDVAKDIIGKWMVTGKVVIFYTADKEVARLNITVSQSAPSNSSTLTLPYYHQFNADHSMGSYIYNATTGKYDQDPNSTGYALTTDNKTLSVYNGQVAFLNYQISLPDSNSLTLVYTSKLVAYKAADNTVKVADHETETSSYVRMQ